MGPIAVLAAVAARLHRQAGAGALPALWLFTDPQRLPDPIAAAGRLPRGAAVVYRHFGAPDREDKARALADLCRRRGLKLLIGADPALARAVGADGVHWPERMVERLVRRRAHAFRLETGAAHGREGLARAAQAGLDACVLSPVFASRSAVAGPLAPQWGPLRAGALARAAGLPVIALGGVKAQNAARLIGRGFAGLAAIDGLGGDLSRD